MLNKSFIFLRAATLSLIILLVLIIWYIELCAFALPKSSFFNTIKLDKFISLYSLWSRVGFFVISLYALRLVLISSASSCSKNLNLCNASYMFIVSVSVL
jgi:hypothetical protein